MQCVTVYYAVYCCVLMCIIQCIAVYYAMYCCVLCNVLMCIIQCIAVYYAMYCCVLCSVLMCIIQCIAVYYAMYCCLLCSVLVCIMQYVAVYYAVCPDTSVVHASGIGQLQANPHVAGPWLSPGKLTRRAVTTMGSNDLVVGEDHMLGPSCQRYNWQTGRCGSMTFGSSPRRGKTLISNPRCLSEVSTCGKDFR